MGETEGVKFDEGLKYSAAHTWAKQEIDLIVVGISDYAQTQLGEIIIVELPGIGDGFDQGERF